jgi:Encapsulating protein for peroxidase
MKRVCIVPLGERVQRSDPGLRWHKAPQVPWTDEQWARVNQVVQEEAQRARTAATFLPLYGPLPASVDFVRKESVHYQPRLRIADKDTTQLATLQLNVLLRGEQLADPEMTSALTLFRRAANIVARLEDALVFSGFDGYDPDVGGRVPDLPHGAPKVGEQMWGGSAQGLLIDKNHVRPLKLTPPHKEPVNGGDGLVTAVTNSIGYLEGKGHFGPFAVVLSQELFLLAQTPVHVATITALSGGGHGPSSVPQDRIVPFLGGGPLLRSSALLAGYGVVVALGGAPIELVVATDMSLQFLQVTQPEPKVEAPYFLFRVYEKVSLRIREVEALAALVPVGSGTPRREQSAGPSPPPTEA